MNNVIIMVGLPNGGKSTWATEYATHRNYVIHSGNDVLERIAKEVLGDDATYNDCFAYVIENDINWWDITLTEAKATLKTGGKVIIDGTHMSAKSRRKVCNVLGVKAAHVVTVIRSFKKVMNQARECKVIPYHVYKNMTSDFTLPHNHTDKKIEFTTEVVIIK